ncbi:hypothetical protein FOTG_19236 [Fusarium oxysporum f. sp. vasinfectum 25433]|uniref:Uncharacterized protein n=1 Tax=Fusarium oxysporum f. sp. vasinfectum 25433 TaxID=1089449 RepID=X0KFH8_FUSOX|nr:hypothetical protein FOTG_19236 [Fusarium oxysporum f. sp. vasinfectum 25433]
MEIYYRGLKEEVKDELYLADRPEEGLTAYVTMAIKINKRQYERRREKANHKRGNDFNPYYPNQRRNDKPQNQQRQHGSSNGHAHPDARNNAKRIQHGSKNRPS